MDQPTSKIMVKYNNKRRFDYIKIQWLYSYDRDFTPNKINLGFKNWAIEAYLWQILGWKKCQDYKRLFQKLKEKYSEYKA